MLYQARCYSCGRYIGQIDGDPKEHTLCDECAMSYSEYGDVSKEDSPNESNKPKGGQNERTQ